MAGSTPAACDHFVLLYGDDQATLAHHVAKFITDGFSKDQAAIVIASDVHIKLFRDALDRISGIDCASSTRDGRLVFLDAAQTLSLIGKDRNPDFPSFQHFIGRRIEALASRTAVRAYGEMVGMLWSEGKDDQAIALERCWIDFQAATPFSLLCAYPIDVFAKDFSGDHVHRILCTHDELLSAYPRLKEALDRAMRDVLGTRIHEARYCASSTRHAAWGHLPEPEATILWLRKHMPRHADEIISHVRDYFSDRNQTA